jgi:hypothetical protein
VIRIGDVYRIPTAGLLELLGVSAEQRAAPAPPNGSAERPAGPAQSRVATRR